MSKSGAPTSSAVGPLLTLRCHGPVDLVRDGEPGALASRKALAVLLVLSLERDVARHDLAAWLWPDQDSAQARRNLRRELFRLRRLGLTLQDGPAGRLRLVGLPVAEAPLTAPTRPFEGLDGVAGQRFDDWLRQARQHELAARAAARQAALVEAADDTGSMLALADAALLDDPGDEVALRAAMRGLQTQGRHDEAQRRYRRLCQWLHDQLGLAPSPETAALAGGIAGPTPPARSESIDGALRRRQPPALPLRLPYVARPALQAAVAAAWRAGQTVVLSGAAGAGKTRLASACAAEAGAWLLLACAPADREQPYAAVTRALRTLREAAPDVELPPWVRRELAQVMPEYGPAPPAHASEEARARLLAGVGEALRRFVADNFAVLVLDDWQWMDGPSVALWSALADAVPGLKLALVHRQAELPVDTLAHLRRALDAGRARQLRVDGMTEAETLALVRALARTDGGTQFTRRLQQATGGNPFFVAETLRHLAESGLLTADAAGHWHTPFDAATEDYAELPLPPSVHEAVRARVRALGPVVSAVLEAASLADGAWPAGALAALLPGQPVHEALAHAAAAALLVDGPGGPVFAHDLVRAALADPLPPDRRRALHRDWARVLGEAGAPASQVAAHLEAAGDRRGAAAQWQRAGAEAWRLHALDEAQAHWTRALALQPTDEGGDADAAVDLRLALLALHRRRADRDAVKDATAALLPLAARAGADARRRARLDCAEAWLHAERVADALALLDGLDASLTDAPAAQRAQALLLRATAHGWAGRNAESQALRRQAEALLAGAPDALGPLGELLRESARQALFSGRPAEARSLARRGVAAFEAAGDEGGLASTLVLAGVAVLHDQGDRAEAMAAFERARRLAASRGLVPTHRGAILNLVKLCTDAGDSQRARDLLDEGLALAPGFESAAAEQAFAKARAYVHGLRGEFDAADAAADAAVRASRGIANRMILFETLLMLADLPLHRGRLDRVASWLDEAQAMHDRAEVSGRAVTLAAKRAWLALAQGDATEARRRLDTVAAVEPDRAEDRWLRAWVAAAVALAWHDMGTAAAALAAVDLQAEVPTDVLAMLLVQHLRLAAAEGRDAPAARARAEALLAAGRVPAAEASALRAAL